MARVTGQTVSGIISVVSLLVCMLVVFITLGECFEETGTLKPVSFCGREESKNRILFIVCFAISTLMILIFVPSRFISLHYSSIGNIKSLEYRSVYFWFLLLHFIPLVLSMPLLLGMAIIPDTSDLGMVHLGMAIAGMGSLLVFSLLNGVLNIIRIIRLCFGRRIVFKLCWLRKEIPNLLIYLACSFTIAIIVGLIIGSVVGLLQWKGGNLGGEWMAVFLIVSQLIPIGIESILLLFLSEEKISSEEEDSTIENPLIQVE